MHDNERKAQEEQNIGSAAPSDESKEVGENAEVPEGEGYEAEPDLDADGSASVASDSDDKRDEDAEESLGSADRQ